MMSAVSSVLAALLAKDDSSLIKKLGEAASSDGAGKSSSASGSSDLIVSALQMAAALAFVLALLLAIAWAVKRWMPGAVARVSSEDRIDILSARQIGMRRSLILAKVKGRIVLLGATPQQISPLSEWESDEELTGDAEDPKEKSP